MHKESKKKYSNWQEDQHISKQRLYPPQVSTSRFDCQMDWILHSFPF